MQGCHDVPANFGHKASKPALLLHVQVVEASYVATGSNHNVARRQGLRRRHSDPILAGDPGVVWRSRAKEQFRLCDHSTLAHATPRSLGEFGGRGTATDMAAYRAAFIPRVLGRLRSQFARRLGRRLSKASTPRQGGSPEPSAFPVTNLAGLPLRPLSEMVRDSSETRPPAEPQRRFGARVAASGGPTPQASARIEAPDEGARELGKPDAASACPIRAFPLSIRNHSVANIVGAA